MSKTFQLNKGHGIAFFAGEQPQPPEGEMHTPWAEIVISDGSLHVHLTLEPGTYRHCDAVKLAEAITCLYGCSSGTLELECSKYQLLSDCDD